MYVSFKIVWQDMPCESREHFSSRTVKVKAVGRYFSFFNKKLNLPKLQKCLQLLGSLESKQSAANVQQMPLTPC